MRDHAGFRTARLGLRFGGLFVALAAAQCGGASTAAVAVGKVGQGLAAHALTVPQGAGVCALKDGLAAQPGVEKPLRDTCAKAVRTDQLWRRAIIVLAAHGETLEAIGAGRGETAGRLEAARTGVRGANWIEVEDVSEKAAREAVTKLVEQMAATEKKDDLAKAINDAAPHVKTLCDKLNGYLDDQARSLADIQKEIEKKRVARTDRRCTTFDNRPICLPDSSTDRVVYASTMSQLAMVESNHIEARDAIAGFCVAHVKLEEAAAGGKLSDDATYGAIVDAVKAEPRAQAAPAATTAAPAAPPAPK